MENTREAASSAKSALSSVCFVSIACVTIPKHQTAAQHSTAQRAASGTPPICISANSADCIISRCGSSIKSPPRHHPKRARLRRPPRRNAETSGHPMYAAQSPTSEQVRPETELPPAQAQATPPTATFSATPGAARSRQTIRRKAQTRQSGTAGLSYSRLRVYLKTGEVTGSAA